MYPSMRKIFSVDNTKCVLPEGSFHSDWQPLPTMPVRPRKRRFNHQPDRVRV